VKRTSKQPGRRAGGQAGRRAGGQAGRRAGGQAGRRAGGQAGRRAGGQAFVMNPPLSPVARFHRNASRSFEDETYGQTKFFHRAFNLCISYEQYFMHICEWDIFNTVAASQTYKASVCWLVGWLVRGSVRMPTPLVQPFSIFCRLTAL
jgi:hypothetical protein